MISTPRKTTVRSYRSSLDWRRVRATRVVSDSGRGLCVLLINYRHLNLSLPHAASKVSIHHRLLDSWDARSSCRVFTLDRLHHSKPRGLLKINTAWIGDQAPPATDGVSAEERWTHLSANIHKSAFESFGKKEMENLDWSEVNLHVFKPLIQSKRHAPLRWKQNP